MSQIASTPTSTRRLRRWMLAAAALGSLLVTASGAPASQDLRSPDARAGVTVQDLRSPDARATAAVTQPTTQDFRSPDAAPDSAQGVPQAPARDLRSPDARESGQFAAVPQKLEQPSSRGFEWGYLALGGLVSLMLAGTVLLVQRRRHRPMPLGG
jgi:hypothetical protein